jgi:hypothetical protein
MITSSGISTVWLDTEKRNVCSLVSNACFILKHIRKRTKRRSFKSSYKVFLYQNLHEQFNIIVCIFNKSYNIDGN